MHTHSPLSLQRLLPVQAGQQTLSDLSWVGERREVMGGGGGGGEGKRGEVMGGGGGK